MAKRKTTWCNRPTCLQWKFATLHQASDLLARERKYTLPYAKICHLDGLRDPFQASLSSLPHLYNILSCLASGIEKPFVFYKIDLRCKRKTSVVVKTPLSIMKLFSAQKSKSPSIFFPPIRSRPLKESTSMRKSLSPNSMPKNTCQFQFRKEPAFRSIWLWDRLCYCCL